MKRIWFFLVFCLLASAIFADPVADFVNGYMKRQQIPGVAVLLRENGKIVRSEGFGLANLELNVPVKPNTVFQSGSIGKQFTATAVMMLVEEGKVALEDPISKYLQVPDTWSGITIRHLLTHTSGLGDYPEDFSLQKDYTEDDLLKMITSQKLSFKPGEKWSYSNLGYVTLGIMIGKVTGKFYGEFLKERIFEPLGMTSTRIISEADIIPNRAAGYELREGGLKNQTWVSPSLNTTADGSLYFTVEELAKWDEAMDSAKLLSRASLQQMWTPAKLNNGTTADYGFGWSIDKTASGHKLIEHGGAWQGFTSHISRYPDDHFSIMTLCNRGGADCTYIAHNVAGLYHPELAPAKHTAKQLDPSILKQYAGDYRLDERLTIKVTSTGGALVTQFGGQKLMLLPESETSFYEEDSERTYRFVKTKSGKITSLIISVPEDLEFKGNA